jgi:hexosaminidase
MEATPLEGAFSLPATTCIMADKNAEAVAIYLRDLLSPAADLDIETIKSSNEDAQADTILLTASGSDKSLGSEGYELEVTPAAIAIRAPEAIGLFYGVQTLRQLLPPDVENRGGNSSGIWEIPAVAIKDKPRFPWRGMHLDVGRHFFPVSFVKKYIDLLAMHKLNVFHWHLTEDQGWRIEIKKYPKLTEIGSKREASPLAEDRYTLDGEPYEGFYTQEEIREVVEHAASRFVQVLPEIEMPGHTVSALAAYPELGCTGGAYKVRTFWGIEEDVYCAGSEKVFEFLEDVLEEVMDLFPGLYIHIGGDESPKAAWQKCEKCQKRIVEEQLKNEDELQSYFIRRIEKFLKANGRQLIGWDEILEGGLAPDATVMSWRGMGGGIEAASQGHDVIMCPLNYTYFDYYQSEDHENEPPAIGGLTPLETVYEFDPMPPELSGDTAKHVLGAQGQLWTEFIAEERHLEYMAFPRASALAEVLWTNRESCDYDDFTRRLPALLQRLRHMNVNFRNPF